MRCNNQYDQLQQELGASYKLGNKPASQQLLAVRVFCLSLACPTTYCTVVKILNACRNNA